MGEGRIPFVKEKLSWCKEAFKLFVCASFGAEALEEEIIKAMDKSWRLKVDRVVKQIRESDRGAAIRSQFYESLYSIRRPVFGEPTCALYELQVKLWKPEEVGKQLR